MGIGGSIFLLALGAILAFAVNADISGLDINVVGWMSDGWPAGRPGHHDLVLEQPPPHGGHPADRDAGRPGPGDTAEYRRSTADGDDAARRRPPPATDAPPDPRRRPPCLSRRRQLRRRRAVGSGQGRADRRGQRRHRAAEQLLQVGAGRPPARRSAAARSASARIAANASGRPTPTRNSVYFSGAQVGVGDRLAGLPGDLGGQLGHA